MAKQAKQFTAVANNTVHNTSKNIHLKPGKNVISGQRLQKLEKALCGCENCACSGEAGLRGDECTDALTVNGEPVEWEYQYDNLMNQTVLVAWI